MTSMRRNDVAVEMTSMRRNDVASTSFRRHVPTRFLINQCQIITFFILKSDIIENSRIELKEIVLPVPSNQIKVHLIHIEIEGKCGWIIGGWGWGGGKGYVAPPPSQIIACTPPPPSSYAYVRKGITSETFCLLLWAEKPYKFLQNESTFKGKNDLLQDDQIILQNKTCISWSSYLRCLFQNTYHAIQN